VNGLCHSVQFLEICDDGGACLSLGLARDFAAGKGTCAGATANADIALQNPGLVPRITWRFLMGVSGTTETNVGRREPGVVVAGCFMMEGCKRFSAIGA
jgi:hypothetical protein